TALHNFMLSYTSVYNQFQTVANLFQQYPQLSALQQKVNDYSGVISSVYTQAYMSSLTTVSSGSYIGTNVTLTPVDLAVPPATTATNAKNTKQVASQVPAV